MAEAINKYGDSTSPAHAPVALAFGILEDTSLFHWMETDGVGEPRIGLGEVDKTDRTKGWRAKMFGQAMRCISSGGATAAEHVHGGFDWDSLGNATVVDVMHGHFRCLSRC